MNKIHSKIWNKSLGMLVVASEHARASGKGGASKRLRASLAAAGVAMALGAAPAMAKDFDASAPGVSSDPTVALGGTAGGRGAQAGWFATALGLQANASGQFAIALGRTSWANGQASMALGDQSFAGGKNSIAIGAMAASSGNSAIAMGPNSVASGLNSLALGSGSYAWSTNSVALGANARTDRANTVSVGNVNTGETRQIVNVGAGNVAAGSNDAVNGDQLYTTNETVAQNTAAIGTIDDTAVFYADASRSAVTLGDGTTPVKVGNVAAGTEATDAVNKSQLDETNEALAQLGQSTATAEHLFSADGATDGSEDALALGQHAVATGANSFATGEESASYGYGSSAYGNRSVAIGGGSGALSDGAAAVGWGANAAATNGTALGYGSAVTGANSVALGANAQADRANTVSVGSQGQERQIANVAAGAQATDAVNKSQLDTLEAKTAQATHLFKANGPTDGSEDATALGEHAVTAGAKSIVLGSEGAAYGFNSIAWGANGTALGARSLAYAAGTTAVGASAAAINENGAAFGNTSIAWSANSTALGSHSLAMGENSVALGANARADRANTVSVGNAGTGETRQIANIAAGTEATDAVNKSQLDETNAAVAQNTAAIGTINDTAVFYTDASRTAVALGDGTTPVKVGNVVAGTEATDAVNKGQLDAAVSDATAVSGHLFAADGATDGSEDALALGQHAVAAGANSFATGEESASYGYGSAAYGNRSVAIGGGSGALSDGATAVGWGANAATTNGTALGYGSAVTAANSVALGANAQADRANTVSVGSQGQERQIANVAAGTEATDAVNKAQFDALAAKTAKAAHFFAANGATDGNEDAVAMGEHAVAVGAKSSAYRDETAAYGFNSFASGLKSVALGSRAFALGSYSVALGTGSLTWSRNSMALGTASAAMAVNSVALGANALANRANTVSVGNADSGETRQIANIAAGTEATDAVNKSQLDETNAAVAQNTAAIGTINDTAVFYTDASRTAVTLGDGTTPVKVGNVAAGTEATDAVNVGQLNALADTTATASHLFAADGATDGSEDAQALGEYTVAAGAGSVASGERGAAFGYGSTASAANSVALGANALADRANTVSVGNAQTGETRQITSVAAGTEATDAVNKGQLDETNAAVAQNTADIAQNTAAIGTINGTAVFYTDASRTAVTLGDSATPVKVGNVAAGTEATDAVNVGQLDALADATATASHLFAANGATDGSEDALASGEHAVAAGASSLARGERGAAFGYGSMASAANSVALGANALADRANTVSVGNAQTGETRQIANVAAGTEATDAVNKGQLDATNAAVAQNTADIAKNAAAIDTINGTAVFYTDASRTAVALGDGTAPVKVGNVAAGAEATDAVNKGQLDSAIAGLADDLGNLADAAVQYDDASKGQITLGGSDGTRISNVQASNVSGDAATVGQVDALLKAIGAGAGLQAGGVIGMPSFNVQGGSYTNVGDALGAMDGVLSGALSAMAGVTVDGPDKATVAAGSKGVAVGSGAKAGGKYGTAIGGDSYAAGPNDTAIGGNAKVNADGSTAVGANTTIAANATNAVAVGESASVSAPSGTAVGQGASVTAAGAVALGQGSTASRANTVSVGSAGKERQVVNVAAGTQGTDAANVSQVQQALTDAKAYADGGDQRVLGQARAYTDQKTAGLATSADLNTFRGQVNDQFRVVNQRMSRVGAMGAAMSQMAFSTQGIDTPNRVGMGVGGYRGQAALSVGYSRSLSRNANLSVGAAVSGNEASGGVGLGIGW